MWNVVNGSTYTRALRLLPSLHKEEKRKMREEKGQICKTCVMHFCITKSSGSNTDVSSIEKTCCALLYWCSTKRMIVFLEIYFATIILMHSSHQLSNFIDYLSVYQISITSVVGWDLTMVQRVKEHDNMNIWSRRINIYILLLTE